MLYTFNSKAYTRYLEENEIKKLSRLLQEDREAIVISIYFLVNLRSWRGYSFLSFFSYTH